MSDKQQVLDAVGRLPDSASLAEISEEVAVLAAIRRGEVAADAGRVVPHDEVRRRSEQWITK